MGIGHRRYREGAARPAASNGPNVSQDWAESQTDVAGPLTYQPHTHEDGQEALAPNAVTTGSPPLAYLAVSAVSVLTAMGLLVSAAHKPLASLISWLLAGPVAILCVGLFLGADTRRRSATVYFGKPWSKTAYTVIALAAVVVAAWAAWAFADWAARR